MSPYGGSREEVGGVQAELERTVLAGELTEGRSRWLRFRRDDPQRTLGLPAGPQAFTAGVYDYANSRNEVVITSQLRAGWYRYITEWRLAANGDITPRFEFSAVTNFCTCQFHIHHAYWRFDLAVDALDDHRIEEHNDPPRLGSDEPWRDLTIEEARERDDDRRRQWHITNPPTRAGYLLEPGWDDAVSDLFGQGDAWLVRHHPDEIDDGQGFTNNWALAQARLDLFADGELVDGHDVVAWYATHWDHHPGDAGDFTGPRLHRLEPAGP